MEVVVFGEIDVGRELDDRSLLEVQVLQIFDLLNVRPVGVPFIRIVVLGRELANRSLMQVQVLLMFVL